MKAPAASPAPPAGPPPAGPAQSELALALGLVGGAVTAARVAIVEALLDSNRLQTPEALLIQARTRAPGTSLATVYRTLERLAAAGRVKRATLASGDVGYAYCPSSHHEHIICLGCGLVQPVRPCLIREEPALEGFTIASHVVDFHGLCAACARG